MNENETHSAPEKNNHRPKQKVREEKKEIQPEGQPQWNMCGDKISNGKKTHIRVRCQRKLLLLVWPHASKFIALNLSVKDNKYKPHTTYISYQISVDVFWELNLFA